MGVPVDNFELCGAGCSPCDGVLWEPSNTPNWFKVIFSGVDYCPSVPPSQPDCNRAFMLDCSWIAGCKWDLWSYNWQVILHLLSTRSTLDMYNDSATEWYFYSDPPLGCQTEFDNYANCWDFDGEHGEATAYPHRGPAFLVSSDYNMSNFKGMKCEKWTLPDNKLMYRIANGLRSVNYLVKWDPRA